MKHSTFISLTAGIAVAACSLLAPVSASASNVEKHIKWGRHRTSAFAGPRMQQIQAANAVLNGTAKRVGGLKRLAPAAADTLGLKPAYAFNDVDYLGDLDGPDGKLWYYTANYDYERIEHKNDWASYVEFIMRGFRFDVYDADMKFVGSVKDTIIYSGDETRVPQADLAPVVTRHFFNTDDNYEIMVGVIYNTKNYVNREYTKVYSIGGEKDSLGYDVCLHTVNEPVGDVLDASTEGKENVFISFIGGGTDYVSKGEEDDKDINSNYWEKYLGNYTEIKTYGPAVDANGPQLVNTYKVKLAQLPGDMQDAPMVLSYMRDGQPYFVAQYYEQPFYNRYNSYMDDMSQREGNNLVVDIYKVANTGFEKVQTTKIPVVRNTSEDKYIASYYSIGGLSYYGDIIENGGADRDFIIDRQDYDSSSDSYVTNFYRYNSKGELTHTIAEAANSLVGMSPLAGQDPQIMFVGTDQYGSNVFNFVNMNTYKTELTIPQVMSMEDSDDEILTANMDRVAVGDSYMYAIELRAPSTDEDGVDHLRVIWVDKDGKFDRIDEVNMGTNVKYATVYMSAATLDPHFFNSDDNHEYMLLVKRAATGGGAQEELIIGQAITADLPNGNTLLDLGPNETDGNLASIVPYEDRLMVSYKKSVDSRDIITAHYYQLPLDKQEDGIADIAGDAAQTGFELVDGAIVADGRIELYSLTGARVAGAEGSLSLQGMRAGIYVVRANGKVAKVVMR